MTAQPAEPAEVPTGTAEPKTNDDFDDTPPPQTQGNPADDGDKLGDAGKQAIDRMKAERNEATKQLKALQKELDQFRQASMTENEKQMAEAKKQGYAEASSEYGTRFARASFDALAARRNPDVNTDEIVEFVDMRRFLDEDGDVNRKALQAAVDRLVPERPSGPPSQDGGPRATSKATDMNSIIRAQAMGGRHP